MDWMAFLAWNDWPDSHGLGGRLQVESVAGFRGLRTDLRLLIKAARISTERDHVADTFYVHNMEEKKVEGIEGVREIRRSLLHQVRRS